MKNYPLILMLGFIFFNACSGSDSEQTSSTENQSIAPDSSDSQPGFITFTQSVSELSATLENVDTVFSKFDALKNSFTAEEKDSAFFVTLDFMSRVEILPDESEIYDEKKLKKLRKKYEASGFHVYTSEGYTFLSPDIKFLSKKFRKDISDDLDAYLDILELSYRQITSDGGLIIEWKDLAEMVLEFEDFLTENSESAYKEDALTSYIIHMDLLMWGLDNTPVVDMWSSDTARFLDPSVKNTYDQLIHDQNHQTGKIIADHLIWMESKNFDFEYEEQQFLTAEKANEYLNLK
jgi:hypothetical protein